MKQQRKYTKSLLAFSSLDPSLNSKSIKSSANPLQPCKHSQTVNYLSQNENRKHQNHSSQIPFHNYLYQIQSLLQFCNSQPSISFQRIFDHFDKQPSSFTQFTNPTNDYYLRKIFCFIFKITKFHNYVPFVYQHKIVFIFQNIFRLLAQGTQPLTNHQIMIFQQTCIVFWNNLNLFTFQVILQNLLTHLIQFSLLLSQRSHHYQLLLAEKLFSLFINQLVFYIQKHKTKSHYFKDILCSYVDSMLVYLLKYQIKSCKNLPLYDIVALSLTSQNHQFFKNLLKKVSRHLEMKKQQIKIQFFDHQDLNSQNESILTMNKIFYSCSLFNFSSVFSSSGQNYYRADIIVYVMILMRQHFLFLIEELEKIQKSSIPNEIIEWHFNFVRLGNSLIQTHQLSQIIDNFRASPYVFKDLFELLGFNLKTENQEQYVSSIIKTIQQFLFQLFYKIQRLLSLFNLQIYKDLYIRNPQTFRSSYFIQNIFKFQYSSTLLSFMIQFTERWLLVNEKNFDFQFYLLQFFDICISKDNLHLIGEFQRSLSLQVRIKISLIVYKMSFNQQMKKIVFPEPNNFSIMLAQLTSAGFSDKFLIVNKLFPDFSQQLVMKQIIRHFFPTENYFIVKAFYHVVHYEFELAQDNCWFLEKLNDSFQKSILQKRAQQAYSIFHYFNCVSFRDKYLRKDRFKNIERRMLGILLHLHHGIITICEVTCSSRREAIAHLTLTQEMINSNFKHFQKLRRMHSLFIKNVVFWFNQLSNIQQLLDPSFSFQLAKEIYERYSKQVLYPQFRFLHIIQRFCSQKHFSNIVQTKIKLRINQESILSTLQFSILFEVAFSFIKSEENSLQDFPFLNFKKILEYFALILETKLDLTNERQILKKKLFILQFLQDLLQFFTRNPENHFCDCFDFCFATFFKKSIIQISFQNPNYVEKYQKELIIHLRIASLQIILLYYKKKYSIIDSERLFSLLFESCFDKNWEIRLMLLNIFTSRFKSDQYSSLLQSQNYIISYLTHFAIFQPQAILNIIAKKIIENIKNIASDESFLGLNILLYSMKLWFSWLRHQISLKKYDVFFETFLKAFNQLWLIKKQWQYQVYAFCENFSKTDKLHFILQEGSQYHSHITPYIVGRLKSDFQLQNILRKHYLESKVFLFSASLQTNQPSFQTNQQKALGNKSKTKELFDQVFYSLSVRLFLKIKQLIEQKPRSLKTLKSKKEMVINWETLEEEKIVLFKQFSEKKYSLLDSFLKIEQDLGQSF